MRCRFLYSAAIGFLTLALTFGCSPKAVTPPPVDVVGTRAAQLVSSIFTQTAAAYSPTPPPVTPSPTPTIVPVTPTETVYVATKRPEVVGFAACWTGPGSSYTLISNISDTKKVELLGVGSVPGWYIVRNPYFNVPCWISADELHIFSDIDLSVYPAMTPSAK